MTSATPIQPAASDDEGRPQSFVQRRPMAAFLLLAFGIGWPGPGIPLIMGLPAAPFVLGSEPSVADGSWSRRRRPGRELR
jgi:hypothetical protein